MSDAAIWHELECGSYRADIGVWLTLAARHGAPVLDVGAGTGRVTRELARAGHDVVALDLDGELLDELARRIAREPEIGARVRTVRADARDFDVGELFPLIIVPMQTIQLLEGHAGRLSFLERARAHLAPDGTLAVAIATALEPFEVQDGEPGPVPDVTEREGIAYFSRPVAVRAVKGGYLLERRRETVARDGERRCEDDTVALDGIELRTLRAEGRRAGLRSAGLTRIPATADHVPSEVVMFNR